MNIEIGQAIRQGDVLLRRVAELPKNTRPKATDGGRLVVEYGEVTGHAHVLNPERVHGYDIVSAAGAIVGQAFEVLETTEIRHDEHGAIALPPGIYERWYQVEDDGEEERRVVD